MLHALLSYFINLHLKLSPYLVLVLPSGLFVSGLPVKILYRSVFSPKPATCPAHPTLIYSIAIIIIIIIIIIQIMNLLITQFSQNPCYFHPLRFKHLSRRSVLEHSPIFFILWQPHFRTHKKR